MSELVEGATIRECLGRDGTLAMRVRSLTCAEREMLDRAISTLREVIPEFALAVDLVTFEAFVLDDDREHPRGSADDYLHVMLDMASFGGLAESAQAGILLHELFHVVDCDVTSAKMRARIGKLHPLQNTCQDAEINDIIRELAESGYEIALPSDVTYSEDLDEAFPAPRGLSGDEYYALWMSSLESQGMHPIPEFNTVDGAYFTLGLHVRASEVRREIQRAILDPARQESPSPFLRKWAQRARFIDPYALGIVVEQGQPE